MRCSRALSLFSALLIGAGAALAQSPAHPFPQHVAYAAGSIRPSQFTPAQMDADVQAFYDYWKKTYLLPAGTTSDGRPRYRVAFGKSGANAKATVSEGQGYGMVIVPLMAGHDPDARQLFDGLYEFAAAYPSHRDPRLMQWKVPIDKGDGADSAFDGDADIAYGLLLANAQWGSAGKVDYATAAKPRLAGILAATIGKESRLPTLGDWAEPGTTKQYEPRSSDFMPGHFRAWARFTKDPTWDTVASNCAAVVTALQANHSSETGLLPDFIIGAHPLSAAKPAGPHFLESANDGALYYNAGRDPWRLGTDALLNRDATSAAQAKKIAAWLNQKTGGQAKKIHAGYHLDGTDLKGNDYFSTFFAAPMGVAAMLDSANQGFLDSIYASVRTKHENYFEDSVTLLCLLVMSGNFWDPTTVGDAPRQPIQPPDK